MSRDLRAVLVGLGIVLVAWLALRGVPEAIASLRRREAALDQRVELLAHAQRRVAEVPKLTDSVQALSEVATNLSTVLLIGRESETATVDLMSRVREALVDRAAMLSGFERRADSLASGPLALTSVTAVLETDFHELLGIVRVIEADPAMGIEGLEVTAINPHDGADVPERLAVRLGVSGWYRPEAEEGPVVPDFGR